MYSKKINSRLRRAAQMFGAAAALALAACCGVDGPEYNLETRDLILRDPYVFADAATQKYYIHANALVKTRNPSSASELGKYKALYCYESPDLRKWRLAGKSFEAPKNWWGKRDYWAPDMFKFGDKYYIVATFSGDRTIGKNRHLNKGSDMKFRGCAVLVSDKPEGPYKPLSDKPITPENWMCLDGTIFEDNGKLYLIFCREWVEIGDGAIYAQEISPDLKTAIGEPAKLFNASEAPWCAPFGDGCYVTDAPVVNRADDGKLFMTWSSGAEINGKRLYAIGLAYSEDGLFGKWKHAPVPLNSDDGGHAMIFKTFGGRAKIAYHAGNKFPERTVIKNFKFTGDDAIISDWKIFVDAHFLKPKIFTNSTK